MNAALFDRINFVSATRNDALDHESLDWRTEIQNYLQHLRGERYQTEEVAIEAIWLTLVANKNPQFGKAKQGTNGRRFCITEHDYIGLVPDTAQVGDLIYIVPGAQTPYAIRNGDRGYNFVGECYVHGIMVRICSYNPLLTHYDCYDNAPER